MEKRKVFKISIIDKEISRTEFDRNTFYTSDSELSLVFKLIERDYSYDHGEILLYNEDDESFVTRKIKKQENDFVYEIDSDIIPHYGTWKAQLQLVNDGDVYTSKPFEFNIVNDLSNLAPQPTLTDINNWGTLKQSAYELIDEMQDIIVDIENAESERANKEIYRQQVETERVSKENKRQQAETERVNKENTRQQAETERVNNERNRRIAEFERVDKENERVNKENIRQQAESGRVSKENLRVNQENARQQAESSRISAEEQRKVDHANRSAEFAGKANKKQEDWITPTLLNGWTTLDFYSEPGYMKDEFGFVHVKGTVKDGAGPVFQLPKGYRSPKAIVFPTVAFTEFGRITLDDVGNIIPNVTNRDRVSINVTFKS